MVADEGKTQREHILRQQMRTIKEELGEGGEEDEIEELRERLRHAQLPDEAQKVARKQLGRLARHAAAVGRVQRHAHVPRVARRPAVEQDHARQARRRRDAAAASTRTTTASRRSRSASSSTSRCASSRGRQEGPDPLLHRPARRRQDVARPVDRALDGAALPPHRARRRARRGRDPRPPAHVRRRAPGAHRPGDEEGRREEPGLRPRRGRQDGRRHAGRSRRRRCSRCSTRSRTARSRTTTSTCRSISRRSRSSHGEQPGHHPGAALGPHGGHRGARATRAPRSGASRRSSSAPKQLSRARAHRRAPRVHSTRASRRIIDSYTREAGVRGLEREIGVGVPARRDAHRRGRDDVRVDGGRRARREGPRRRRASCRISPSARASPGVATGLAWTPSGGDILFIEATKMPGKGDGHRHRQPEERDEERAATARLVRAQPREGARARPGVPEDDRPAPARAEGRHAEGRAERGRDDVHRGRVAAARVRR